MLAIPAACRGQCPWPHCLTFGLNTEQVTVNTAQVALAGFADSASHNFFVENNIFYLQKRELSGIAC